MVKKVIYNGGTESYYGCSNLANLVVGKEYNVVSIIDHFGQTDYILEGIVGEFNSVWFDEINDKVYMAISNELPVIGQKYSCSKMEFINGNPYFIPCFTSTVNKFKHIGNNIYHVTTRNSVYIVNVV